MAIDYGEYADHVAHYKERGYTVFPQLYGDRQMAAWRDKLDELHAEYGEWWLRNTLEYAPKLFWPAVSHPVLLDFAELVMGPFVQLDNLTLAGFGSVPVEEAEGKVSGWHRDRWGKVPRGSAYQRPNAVNAIGYLPAVLGEGQLAAWQESLGADTAKWWRGHLRALRQNDAAGAKRADSGAARWSEPL
jgi:hypothetical protein